MRHFFFSDLMKDQLREIIETLCFALFTFCLLISSLFYSPMFIEIGHNLVLALLTVRKTRSPLQILLSGAHVSR